MLVSIIIPTYKRVGMLDRAIKSCLNQTYKNIEIIIVDDNNNDTEDRKMTEAFMQKYDNNIKIKYIKRDKNGGGALARNTGIAASSGDYIAFLDDDDTFYSSKIESQLEFMIKNNLDASFTASETYDEKQKKIIKTTDYKNIKKYKSLFVFHLVEMIISTQTFMYKKSVLKDINNFENVPGGQDYYLMYKTLYKNFKVAYLPKVFTTIYIHTGERITTKNTKLAAENFLYNLKMRSKKKLTYSQIRYIKYIYKRNVYHYYKDTNQFLKTWWYLALILANHPIILIKGVIKEHGYEKNISNNTNI